MNKLNIVHDEIVSIEYVGEKETIDINVDGDRLFFANDILTHNSAVEEVEFDHSHISGGISKINTADNVFGIFTSRAMRERGKYQYQLMKTRSSSGVGQKIDLDFNIETLRITDPGVQQQGPTASAIMEKIKASKSSSSNSNSTAAITDDENISDSSIKADVQASKLKSMLADLKSNASKRNL